VASEIEICRRLEHEIFMIIEIVFGIDFIADRGIPSNF
jgi:hypothetical protein